MPALKALVIGMGLLIVAGTALVVVKLVELSGESGPPAAGAEPARLALGMAESCRVAEAWATGQGIVLRYAGPAKDGCDVLHLVDPAGGRLLATIAPHDAPAAPDAAEAGGE